MGSGNVGLIVSYQLMQAGAEIVTLVEAAPRITGYRVHAGKIERAGVFPYSPEEGTPAAEMERPDTETAEHRAELLVPYAKGGVLSLIHEEGQVLREEYTAEGTQVECLLDAALYQRVQALLKG